MSLLLLGLNHNSADLSIREQVAFAPEKLPQAMRELQGLCPRSEVSILSTCNRTELLVALEAEPPQTEESIKHWLADFHSVDARQLEPSLYAYRDEAAVRHLMHVASGLDSLVLGEPQILGQLKSAFALAQDSGTVGSTLNRLHQRVFASAKRVRSETAIGENPVSVAYAAVDLAGRIYESFSSVSVLLVGAGETIELVGRHLQQAGAVNITIANRTLDRGLALAEKLDAEVCVLGDLPEVLPRVDIVVSSTASQLPIIGKGQVETALRKRRHKPMLLVDIAVPRDVEPEVAELQDVYLYTVDDLREIVDQNMAQREIEADKAKVILDEEVQNYLLSLRADASKELITRFRDRAQQTAHVELERARRELESGRAVEDVLEAFARGLTNKLIHWPSQGLRSIAQDDLERLQTAAQLLGLDDH